jgi:hypothetical protein
VAEVGSKTVVGEQNLLKTSLSDQVSQSFGELVFCKLAFGKLISADQAANCKAVFHFWEKWTSVNTISQGEAEACHSHC